MSTDPVIKENFYNKYKKYYVFGHVESNENTKLSKDRKQNDFRHTKIQIIFQQKIINPRSWIIQRKYCDERRWLQ